MVPLFYVSQFEYQFVRNGNDMTALGCGLSLHTLLGELTGLDLKRSTNHICVGTCTLIYIY
jgi:hypothetical protein